MKKEKKNIILIGLGVVLLVLIAILVAFLMVNKKEKEESAISTTSTTTELKVKELMSNGIILNYENCDLIKNNYKLVVTEVSETINLENLLKVYDINVLNENGNIVKIDNSLLKISIPFNNLENYSNVKVLYLNDKNEVVETLQSEIDNGIIRFNVNHLSRFAIVGVSNEINSSTTTTTKKTIKTSKKTTTKKQEETTTTKRMTTTKPTTTTTTTMTTTKTTTTQKVKTYTYMWSETGDSAGQYYLYIVDDAGNKVNGSVTVTYVGTTVSETVSVSTSGKLFIKSIVTISNVKAN